MFATFREIDGVVVVTGAVDRDGMGVVTLSVSSETVVMIACAIRCQPGHVQIKVGASGV